MSFESFSSSRRSVTAAALIVGTVVAAAWYHSSKRSLWGSLRNWSLLSTSYWLLDVKIPIANVPSHVKDSVQADAEGLVLCHIHVEQGRIAQVIIAGDDKPVVKTTSTWTRSFSAKGAILMPCFVDAHTHLIKTHTAPRLRNALGTWSQALTLEFTSDNGEVRWQQPGDVYRRMEFAIQSALYYGTKALRTHLDGTASSNPAVIEAVYQAFAELQHKYRNVVTLQGVANLRLAAWLEKETATAHANKASTYKNVVLGAYMGNPGKDYAKEAIPALTELFRHAHRLEMDVDLHVDETNDPSCGGLLAVVESLRLARQAGYQGRVVLGHACALSLSENQDKIIQGLQALGRCHVVANPTTNMVLQDRRGSIQPHSIPIDGNVPRTPKWRGLAAIQECRAAGLAVAAATDNVRDHWYPYGDYDMLAEVWLPMLQLAHLDTAPTACHWADLCNDAAAAAMGLPPVGLAVGLPADFIVYPTATRLSELLGRPRQVDRVVVRNGRVWNGKLPVYTTLEDLVS